MGMVVFVVVFVALTYLWVGAAVRFLGAIFLSENREAIAKRPFLHVLWLIAAAATACFILFMPAILQQPGRAKYALLRAELAMLTVACKNYMLEYDSYPQGNNAAITQTLLSNNLRRIVFIELNKSQHNQRGEVIDPWGTPLKFSLAKGLPPRIQSAGSNRIFGDADDLATSEPTNSAFTTK